MGPTIFRFVGHFVEAEVARAVGDAIADNRDTFELVEL